MLLTNDQLITYLSNIIYVARVDGKITASETKAIEEIQKRFGAKKNDLNKATKKAENPDFKINLVGHFSDKIKNLEDIIYVSLIDGELDEKEKSLFIEATSDLKINSEQIDIIIDDVKNYLDSQSNLKVCVICNSNIDPNAKFCPECGTPVSDTTSEPSVNVSYEIPNTGITIEFAESTAAGFADAVSEQSNAPINKICEKGKKNWYLACWPEKDFTKPLKLVDSLKGMRNRKVYVDGEEQRWDDIFGFSWCAEQRNSAYKPIEYCFGLDESRFNIWGCKQSRMDWSDWANWFTYGNFEKVGLLKNQVVFRFNKEKIKHELSTNLFKCKYCPHIKFDFIEKILEKFPNEIIINDKSDWKYKKDYNETPGAIKVITKTTDDGYTFTDEFYSSGVVPKSISIGMELIKSVIKESNNFNEIKQILEHKG
jgi:rRNA maturation endonuclease Nob1